MSSKTPAEIRSIQLGTKRDSTPLDVVRRVAHYLERDQAYSTLASLLATCKSAYHVLTPKLYRNLIVKAGSSDGLIDLVTLDEGIEEGTIDSFISQVRDEEYFDVYNPVRRLVAFKHVRRIIIRSFPSNSQSKRLLTIAKALSHSDNLLFPNVETVEIHPDAVDGIRTYSPDEYDRPHNPPFLEALVASSRPRHLCMSFRVVPSDRWEEHQAMTSQGAYKLVSRIQQLGLDGWSSLETFDVHDAVHQVLPSLSGCSNSYHFAPHILYPDRYRNGRDGVNIPGPQYNFRAWQVYTTIKNLFPSGGDSKAALQGTSWTFVNVSGHVLKKLVRDDDDETGVGYDEVLGLVKGQMKNTLPQDLPMREGFGRELVDEVMDRIRYVDEDEQQACGSCSRSNWEGAIVSNLADLEQYY